MMIADLLALISGLNQGLMELFRRLQTFLDMPLALLARYRMALVFQVYWLQMGPSGELFYGVWDGVTAAPVYTINTSLGGTSWPPFFLTPNEFQHVYIEASYYETLVYVNDVLVVAEKTNPIAPTPESCFFMNPEDGETVIRIGQANQGGFFGDFDFFDFGLWNRRGVRDDAAGHYCRYRTGGEDSLLYWVPAWNHYRDKILLDYFINQPGQPPVPTAVGEYTTDNCANRANASGDIPPGMTVYGASFLDEAERTGCAEEVFDTGWYDPFEIPPNSYDCQGHNEDVKYWPFLKQLDDCYCITCLHVEIDIDGVDDAEFIHCSECILKVGEFVAGEEFRLDCGITSDFSVGWTDRSTSKYTQRGIRWSRCVPPRRVMTFTIQTLDKEQAFSEMLYSLQRKYGVCKSIIFVPAETGEWVRYWDSMVFLSHMKTVQSPRHRHGGKFSVTIDLEEEL